jgi:hypothetical protein
MGNRQNILNIIRVEKEATLNRGTSKQIGRHGLAAIIHGVSPLSITPNGGIVSPVPYTQREEVHYGEQFWLHGTTLGTGIGRRPI